MLLVMLAHAGVPWLGGGYIGVDVFFVLSGFLITGLLVRDATEHGHVSIARFYGNRAKRVLPAATVVLLSTLVAAVNLPNYVRAGDIVRDSIWSALFASNIRFATAGTDYFASDLPPSPVQHFWSLAVEEQFYLVWPLLVGIVLAGGRVPRSPHVVQGRRRLLGWLLLLICAASLSWSAADTAGSPESAYFSTFTRAWELGAGALLALYSPRVSCLSRRVKQTLSWTGLLVVIASALALSSATPFPGVAALTPVLGTVAIIAGGMTSSDPRERGSPTRGAGYVLGRQPLRWVGDASYSLYLWHWPVLVIAAAYAGRRSLGLSTNLTLLGGATLAAAITYRFVENPIRHRESFTVKPSRALVLWPLTIAPILVAALLIQHHLQAIPARQAALGARLDTGPGDAVSRAASVEAEVVGTLSLARQDAPVPGVLRPAVDKVSDDHAYMADDCLAMIGQTSSDLCPMGSTRSAKKVVLFGDSHASMYVPGLSRWASSHRYKLIPIIKDSCSSVRVIPRPYAYQGQGAAQECSRWQRWAFDQVERIRPEIVVMSNRARLDVVGADGKRAVGSEARALWSSGVRQSLTELEQDTKRVVVLGDLPTLARPPTDCLASRDLTLGTCVLSGTEIRNRDTANALTADAARADHDEYVDTTAWYCDQGRCPLIVGTTVVWSDTGHITATRSRDLARAFAAALSPRGS